MMLSRALIIASFAALVLLSVGSVAHAQTAGAWDTRAVVPSGISGVTGIIYAGTGDDIYAVNENAGKLWRYDVDSNAWTELTALTGCAPEFVVASGGFLYANCPAPPSSTDFRRYTISADSWDPRTDSPGFFGSCSGSSAVVIGNDIYATAGSGTDFYKYSISGNSWTALNELADAPGNILCGGDLAYTGSGDFIYALVGNGGGTDSKQMYRYSISGNSWSPMADTPSAQGDGGALVGVTNDLLYALRGTGTDFWSYDPTGNSWTTLTGITAAVGGGAALAAYDLGATNGRSLFAMRGDSTTDFYRYTISTAVAADTGVSHPPPTFQVAQGLLARSLQPNAPTDVQITPGLCDNRCMAAVKFSYTPLGLHVNQPHAFAFVDERSQKFGELSAPAILGNYTMELKELHENSPIAGRLCAIIGPKEGCALASGWSLFGIDPARIKIGFKLADDKKGSFNVSLIFDRLPLNAQLDATGVAVTIWRKKNKNGGAMAAKASASNVNGAREFVAEDFLRFTSSGISPLKTTLIGGEYVFQLTPQNARGIQGLTVEKEVVIAPLAPAIILQRAEVRVEEDELVADISVVFPREDTNNLVLIDPTFLFQRVAAQKDSVIAAIPEALRGGFEFTVVSRGRGIGASARSVEFFGKCEGATGASCNVDRVVNRAGNASSEIKFETKRNTQGGVVVVAGDAALLWTAGFFPVSATLDRIGSVTLALTIPLRQTHSGKGQLSIVARDVFANEARFAIPFEVVMPRVPSEAKITDFTVNNLTEEAGAEAIVARGMAEGIGQAAVFLNIFFEKEEVEIAEARLRGLVIEARETRGNATIFNIDCAEVCALKSAQIIAPNGQIKEASVNAAEKEDGSLYADVEGIGLTFDREGLPAIIGLVAENANREIAQVTLTGIYEPLTQSGAYTATFRADEAEAAAQFIVESKLFDLLPQIALRAIVNLHPIIAYFSAPSYPKPIITVEGARVIQRPFIQRISGTLSPVSPLIKALEKFF